EFGAFPSVPAFGLQIALHELMRSSHFQIQILGIPGERRPKCHRNRNRIAEVREGTFRASESSMNLLHRLNPISGVSCSLSGHCPVHSQIIDTQCGFDGGPDIRRPLRGASNRSQAAQKKGAVPFRDRLMRVHNATLRLLPFSTRLPWCSYYFVMSLTTT